MRNKIKQISALFITLIFVVKAEGFYIEILPQISVDEEYSDNIDRSHDHEEHDYSTKVSPEINFDVTGETAGAKLFYSPTFVYYKQDTSKDMVRHNARFRGWNDLGKNTRLELNNSFLLTDDPGEEEDVFFDQDEALGEPDTTIRQGREQYYTNTTNVNLSHQFGESDFLRAGYRHSIRQDDDPNDEDNRRMNPFLGVTYWFNKKIGMETEASYTRGEFSGTDDPSDDFDSWKGSMKFIKKFTKHFKGFINYDHTVLDYQGEDEDYVVYHPSVGIDYTITDDTNLSLGVGYYIRDKEKSDDDSGLTIEGNLGKTWEFRRGLFDIDGSMGYSESHFGSENLGFEEYAQIQGRAEYSFTKRLTGNARYSYRHSDYLDTDSNRTDRKSKYGLGLDYEPARWISLSLDYSYNTVDSTVQSNEYDENRVKFMVSIFPVRPFRF